jgi:hypothetical protein
MCDQIQGFKEKEENGKEKKKIFHVHILMLFVQCKENDYS